MNEPVEMTAAELRAAIFEAQGWKMRSGVTAHDGHSMPWIVWERAGVTVSDDRMGDPTTDIVAAWLLLEEMRDAGRPVTILSIGPGAGWACGSDGTQILTRAETAPAAISMAYYEWKTGRKVEIVEVFL